MWHLKITIVPVIVGTKGLINTLTRYWQFYPTGKSKKNYTLQNCSSP